jgi:serine/threonine protein kinase
MAAIKDQNGKTVVLGKKLGQGGEGAVFDVVGEPQSVAKQFFDFKLAYYEPRLREMVPNPPVDQTRKLNPPHISIAWPERILFENGKFFGYIMPRIGKAEDIFEIYSPAVRKKEFPEFDWRHLHRVAYNLAVAVNAYHAAGYVIGDLNAKNVMVNKDALVTMVDTDSIQITAANGTIMRCPVGTPEFTPPELQGKKLDQYDRTVYHDAFGLSVMIFLLLMEGQHPYSGAPINPSFSVSGPVYQHCIKNGIFPYKKNSQFKPPVAALDFNALHPDIQKLFMRSFVDGHNVNTKRPLPAEWVSALEAAEKSLVECKQVPGHWYGKHNKQCPWCEREKVVHSGSTSQPQVGSIPVQKRANFKISRKKAQPMSASINPNGSKGKLKFWMIGMGMMVGLAILFVMAGGMRLFGSFFSSSGTRQVQASDKVAELKNIYEDNEVPARVVEAINDVDPETLPDISSACAGAPSLKFSIGDQVKVITGSSLRGRSSPEINETNVTSRYDYGNTLDIFYGPVCYNTPDQRGYWFWYVLDGQNQKTWVAEGDMSIYYLQKVE